MSTPPHANGVSSNVDIEGQRAAPSSLPENTWLPLNTVLSLEQFRELVGILQEDSQVDGQGANRCAHVVNKKLATQDPAHLHSTASDSERRGIRCSTTKTFPTIRPRLLIFLRVFSRPEHPTLLYYSLMREESDLRRQHHIYNIITYTCLILQLIIASALVIVGAIPSVTTSSTGAGDTYKAHRISVAILGAVTGLLTGILSLLNGQGLPQRLLQSSSRLRQIRDRIEFIERTLRANVPGTTVTYQAVQDIYNDYENALTERDMNRPDAWATNAAQPRSKVPQ